MKKATLKAEDGFKGTIETVVPSRSQKSRLAIQMNYSGEDKIEGLEEVQQYDKALKAMSPYILKVAVSHEESGTKYKSWGEMQDCAYCDELCEKVLNFILTGKQLGEAQGRA